jgi:hypothetical protein
MASFIMISGSRDNQESADEANGGAFTIELLKVLNESINLSYLELLRRVRVGLKSKGHIQVPQLSSSVRMDMKQRIKVPELFHRKFALLIGINYVGDKDGALYGCHADVRNTKKFLIKKLRFHENDIVILMDDDGISPRPTRSNIEDEFANLTQAAIPGDYVWIHYSGHGRSQRDDSGDEKDKRDETIEPMDFLRSGQMKDEDLNMLLSPMRSGVSVTAVFDSCFSGSVLDFPFVYS